MEDHPTDQLDVEVALSDGALGGLTGYGERLGQQGLERLPAPGALAQVVGPLAKLGVRVELHLGLEVVDAADALLELLELLALSNAEGAVDKRHSGESSSGGRPVTPVFGAPWGCPLYGLGMPVDPLAERAFSVRADHYERARPGWPPEAVELQKSFIWLTVRWSYRLLASLT